MKTTTNLFMNLKISYSWLLSIFVSFSLSGQIIDNYNTKARLDYSLIPYCSDKLCGYVDRNGLIKIKADFDGVSFFNEHGFAQIKKYGLYGVIDRSGKEIVKPISTRTLRVAENVINGVVDSLDNAFFAINVKAKEWIYFTDAPKVYVSKNYHQTEGENSYKVGDAQYSRWQHPGFFEGKKRAVAKDKSCNIIDISGKELLHKNIPYAVPSKDGVYIMDSLGKIGIIDFSGKEILKNKYSYIGPTDKFGYRSISANLKYGILDETNAFILDTIYRIATPVAKDKFIVSGDSKKQQLINNSGKQIFSNSYSYISHLVNVLYSVQDSNEHFLMNEQEEILAGPFPNRTQTVKVNQKVKLLFNRPNDATVIFDTNGKEIFSSEKYYHIFEGVKETEFILQNKERQELLLDNKGKILIQPSDDIMKSSFQDCYIVSDKNEMGLFSGTKGWLIPMGNHEISNYSKSDDNKSRIRVETEKTSTFYYDTMDEKTVEPNTHDRWGVTKKREKTFISLTFNDGREMIFPNDKKTNLKYTYNYAYLTKRFEDNKLYVYNEMMQPILPDGYSLHNSVDIDRTVYFIAASQNWEYGLADINGDWIIEPVSRQSIRDIDEKYWSIGDHNAVFLYDLQFNKISKKPYSGFKLAPHDLILAFDVDGLSMDILNAKGEVISEAEYTQAIRTSQNDLILEKSKNNELRTCQIGPNGEELVCYPYADFYIPQDQDFIIAKDLHDFGVVDRQGNQKIPFMYKSIRFDSNINVFVCKKEDYSNDLYDANFIKLDFSAKNLNKTEKIKDYYYLQGSEKTAIFDASGTFLARADHALHGKISTNKNNSIDEGLLWLYTRNGGGSFLDLKNKKILLPN